METDHNLLKAARAMNKDALVKIFDLYSPALFRYALRLCSDPMLADQIVGDVFAKFLEQLAAGNGPRENLRSYLYETTYHQIIDETRYSRRRLLLEVTDWLSPAKDGKPAAAGLEDQLMFEQLLHVIRHELSDDQRHVIVLRFLEGFNIREIALIIGKQEGNVKVIQSRALAKLRESLERKELRRTAPSHPVPNIPKALGI